MKQPKVIGFVPAYNAAAFIEKTLDALAKQTYSNFEIWICDDASTDETALVCARYCAQDARFRFFQNERNLGWWRTTQLYWAKVSAESEYCFYQPHDDLNEPDFISYQVDLLEKNRQAILCVPGIKNTRDGKSNLVLVRDMGMADRVADRIIPLMHWQIKSWWTAIHGLHRSAYIPKIVPINYLRFGEKEFALDLVWLVKLAAYGRFVCADKVLFEKVYSNKTLSGSWKYNTKNRMAVYVAILELVLTLPLDVRDKVAIFGSVFRKGLKALLSRRL